jgi:uncharacterized protein (DUF1778 family)
MARKATRTTRIQARIAPSALRIIRRAAQIRGLSVSEFVAEAALEAARRTIEDANVIRLTAEESRRFAELILNPPPLTPAMKRAKSAYERLVRQPRP